MGTKLQEAIIDGRDAGRLNLSAGLNPYRLGTEERAVWESNRSAVIAQRLAFEANKRARVAICRYGVNVECSCGGRGLCLDVA